MSRKLVTIATFDQPPKAQLARNALEEAGIPVVVNDETLVAMDWLLANAVGGVKVQVWEEDADRAVAVLESKLGGAGRDRPDHLPDDEPDDRHDGPDRPAPVATHDEQEPPPAPGSREDYARRLVFTSILGLVIPFVAFYALYLFFNAMFGEGELSSRGRSNLSFGGLMTVAGLVWVAVFFGVIL
jgi:hypothetical protein